jgi:hypothetical protein
VPSRRRFLQAGLAAPLLPRSLVGLVRDAEPVAASPLDRVALYRVVYDERFAASVDYARAAAARRVPTVRIAGDVTDFWFHDLSLRWREAPVAIAGLTAHGPLFCLERFAWDHGLRVVSRYDCGVEAGESLVSWLIAPKGVTAGDVPRSV